MNRLTKTKKKEDRASSRVSKGLSHCPTMFWQIGTREKKFTLTYHRVEYEPSKERINIGQVI